MRTDILCNKNSRLELAYNLLHVVFLDSVHESILGEGRVFQLEVAKSGGEGCVCVCVVRERTLTVSKKRLPVLNNYTDITMTSYMTLCYT